MLKIGITGQKGFIGSYLANTIDLFPSEFKRIEFDKKYFDDFDLLNQFVNDCDVIVHLAAMNRHNDPNIIYKTNVDLVRKLVRSLTDTNSKAHVILSSSTQEMYDNHYGLSKKEGRNVLIEWANKNNGKFTGIIIPNVFGPFSRPNYNSVVATFCYQLVNDELPVVDIDKSLNLIYVGDLVSNIINEIRNPSFNSELLIRHTDSLYVSELLQILKNFKSDYLQNGIIPPLRTSFLLNLFNTFRSFLDLQKIYPRKLFLNQDMRGAFVEVIRLNDGGQVSFSTTVPSITRGNHFHTRKIERFAVIKGKALIQLRKIGTEQIFEFMLDGEEPSYIDMPIWYTHNITNIGNEDLFTIFWINEFFNPNDTDTFFQQV